MRRKWQSGSLALMGALVFMAALGGLAEPPATQSPQSSLSVDNPANIADFTRYAPYNTFPQELDLWNLEGKRFVRSPVVLSPDKSVYAYSEVLFVPYNRQTFSRLYRVETPPLPAKPLEHLPSEDALKPAPPVDYTAYNQRFEPDKNLQRRQTLLEVGYKSVQAFDFKTLTIVDWSATGRKLLFKEKSGVLHVGLRTSDILVYDRTCGTVTIYPEIRRVIEHYWQTKANLPHINAISWELYPLGFEPGSDSAVLLKAWAMDSRHKKFLGVWRYDVDAERTELVSLNDEPVSVGANGLIATPLPTPSQPDPSFWKRWRAKLTPGASNAVDNAAK